jgi:hypothetical protein
MIVLALFKKNVYLRLDKSFFTGQNPKSIRGRLMTWLLASGFTFSRRQDTRELVSPMGGGGINLDMGASRLDLRRKVISSGKSRGRMELTPLQMTKSKTMSKLKCMLKASASER